MSFLKRAALVTLGLALAAPTLASADTYSTATFTGGVFGNNAAVMAPFGDAGITRGMTFSGTFLIDNSIIPPSVGFSNTLFSSYADAGVIPGSVDLSFHLGSLAFDSSSDPADAIQYNKGHFNGFAYTSDFTFENVGYELVITGGVFQIQQQGQFSPLVSGFLNIGDGAVTGKTPFTPTQPGGGNGGVPEPATWAMMIAGFGLAGVALRRRRGLAAAA